MPLTLKNSLFLLLVPALAISAYAVHQLLENQNSRNVENKISPSLKKQFAAKKLTYGAPIFIRIFKESSELEIWVKKDTKFVLFKTYPIANFSGTLGPKTKEGDLQAPEGFYFVKPEQMNPNSRFHLSFNLGYPNAYDRAHERTGSALMVHGGTASVGCYAMTDPLIEEIYTIAQSAFKGGQPFFRVHIFPFRITQARLERENESKWYGFWKNLKEGYDHFEKHKVPPNTIVRDKNYIFKADS